jgi:hypothetical protein
MSMGETKEEQCGFTMPESSTRTRSYSMIVFNRWLVRGVSHRSLALLGEYVRDRQHCDIRELRSSDYILNRFVSLQVHCACR